MYGSEGMCGWHTRTCTSTSTACICICACASACACACVLVGLLFLAQAASEGHGRLARARHALPHRAICPCLGTRGGGGRQAPFGETDAARAFPTPSPGFFIAWRPSACALCDPSPPELIRLPVAASAAAVRAARDAGQTEVGRSPSEGLRLGACCVRSRDCGDSSCGHAHRPFGRVWPTCSGQASQRRRERGDGRGRVPASRARREGDGPAHRPGRGPHASLAQTQQLEGGLRGLDLGASVLLLGRPLGHVPRLAWQHHAVVVLCASGVVVCDQLTWHPHPAPRPRPRLRVSRRTAAGRARADGDAAAEAAGVSGRGAARGGRGPGRVVRRVQLRPGGPRHAAHGALDLLADLHAQRLDLLVAPLRLLAQGLGLLLVA
jgi:hypothetical protein